MNFRASTQFAFFSTRTRASGTTFQPSKLVIAEWPSLPFAHQLAVASIEISIETKDGSAFDDSSSNS